MCYCRAVYLPHICGTLMLPHQRHTFHCLRKAQPQPPSPFISALNLKLDTSGGTEFSCAPLSGAPRVQLPPPLLPRPGQEQQRAVWFLPHRHNTCTCQSFSFSFFRTLWLTCTSPTAFDVTSLSPRGTLCCETLTAGTGNEK